MATDSAHNSHDTSRENFSLAISALSQTFSKQELPLRERRSSPDRPGSRARLLARSDHHPDAELLSGRSALEGVSPEPGCAV